MANRSNTVVDLQRAILHRAVLELRYDFGQLYYDRTGRICRQIVSDHEGWDFGEIGIKGAQLAKQDQNLVFSFNDRKLDLQQTQTGDVSALLNPAEFGKLAEELVAAVIAPLELETFPRIGYRVWHLFGSDSREQSFALMRGLRAFTLGADIEQLGDNVKQVNFTMVLDRGTHMARLALAPFEQNVELPDSVTRVANQKARNQSKDQRRALIDQQKAAKVVASFPRFGLMMDVDFYVEEPPFPHGLSISDFVATASEDLHRLMQLVLMRRTQ